MELINFDLAFAAMSAIAAGIVFGFAGFGSGYVLVPLFSLVFGPVEAVAVVMMMATIGGVGLTIRTARYADWKRIAPLAILSVLMTPVGTMILLAVDPEIMRRAVGLAVLFLSVLLMLGITIDALRNTISACAAGVLTGLVNGSVGIGGLTANIFIMSSEGSAVVQRAGVVVVGSVISAVAIASFAIQNAMDSTTIARALILMVPFGITAWCGVRVFRITPGPVFRRIVLAFVMTLGIITLAA
ncbi:MAG: hypothetical protein CL569_03025 [Alphaproteobacteria bacterium]|nr:hypothetical protein [Alphaproteobacteria bacterium]